MTRKEYVELYDSLYYGHEVELLIKDSRYYLEQCENGMDIYLLGENQPIKVFRILEKDRALLIDKIVLLPFCENRTLCDNYMEFDIIAID